MHNNNLNCHFCPAVKYSQSGNSEVVSCKRRSELGEYNPKTVTFDSCPEWQESSHGLILKDMRVMILGIDGYLGWTLALWLGALGCRVSGVDNFGRRDWVSEVGSESIVPIAPIEDRLQVAREKLGIDINFRKMDITNKAEITAFIKEVQPEAVVHYAECPSAPYSMIDFDHAAMVQQNNVIGTLALLFAIHEETPETPIIKLGTMGEYGTPLSGRPLFEGYFPDDSELKWQGKSWSLAGEMTPRDPASFYHVSKVQDTVNVHKACRFWNLRSYDVMQGVIFGVHTPQTAVDERLRTRYDIDECFGTVLNRFAAQALIGYPLTIYGAGKQTRGFIALEDAMQCITRLIIKPPAPGRYEVVNQMSGYHSMKGLAEMVAKVAREKQNLDVKIQHLENPRVEAAEHPYDPIYKKLPDEFGFKPLDNPELEIERIFELISKPEIKQRIEAHKDILLPKTWWSGKQAVVKSL